MAVATGGLKKLRKLNFGPESTAGTAVSAAHTWRGQATIEDTRETVFLEEDVGRLMGYDKTYVPVKGALLVLEETPLSFEHAVWVFGMGIEWQTTGATAGTAGMGGYVYTHDYPTTAAKATKTFTWEGGDNQEYETFDYGIMTDFTLSGAPDEAVMVTATIVGREITTAAALYGTAALAVTEEALFNKMTVYIDAIDGTMGTTTKGATLIDFSYNAVTGYIALKAADGNIAYASHKQTTPEITVGVTMEWNGTAEIEKEKWRTQTPRLFEIRMEGTVLADTSGGNYTYKTIRLMNVGKWESFDKLGENNGNDIIAGTFRLRENSTGGQSAVIVVNDNAAYT